MKREREPGVWDVQVSAGKDPATGKRKRGTRRIRGTAEDADRALTAMLYEADTGKHGGSLASCRHRDRAVVGAESDDLSPTTARRYRQIIDGYLLERWGAVRIADLDISELTGWFRSLHRRDGLSPATVPQIRAVFRRAMEEAVRWDWIDTNPVRKARGVPVKKHRVTADEPAVIVGLIEAAAATDPDLAAWITVSATTGMRRSEMAGLLWADVDLDEG